MTDTLTRVGTALAGLAELVETLEVELTDATPEPSTSSGKPTSRPPVDLTIVSDIQAAWNGLTAWARDWCEVMDLTGPASWTWPAVTLWMSAHWPNVYDRHPAADDFAHDLLHRCDDDCLPGCTPGWVVSLRHHDPGHVRVWQPLPGRWVCPVVGEDGTCGGKLLEHVDHRVTVCRRCGASWQGHEYEQLGRLLGCDTVVTIDQAALLAKVHRASVYRWIESGALPSTPQPDGTRTVDTRDLALIAARRNT